jgi:ligand-binding sensor domain-containing protein
MSILEDRNGGIWVALDDGVARQKADGWILYRKKDGLSERNIYQLEEDNQSRIWAFGRTDFKFAGLSVFEGGKWHKFTKKDYKLKSAIESLTMHQNEVIAFAKDGLAVFTDKGWHKYNKNDGLTEKEYVLIRKNRFGIWLAGETGFYQFNEGKWKQLHPSADKWDVNVIFVENRERIWLGTEKDGVYRYNNNKWDHFTEESGLTDNRILDIFKDKKGIVWITTKSGITRVLTD